MPRLVRGARRVPKSSSWIASALRVLWELRDGRAVAFRELQVSSVVRAESRRARRVRSR
ncbi:hypothetical protein OHB12_00800 [Nocardia sp. NBC_01730]|uniref:hypothetical protein n=1 Tax=Nocardia sp. NBC_01730 TaxID=2975998 RepID=UPI002E14A1E9|nr:hypothetical protein OHB12_00800 [Nocardia sp. NBC_01730]